MYKIRNARANCDLLFFVFVFFFFMIKYANLRRSCRRLVWVINAPNWFITTLRELMHYEKLLIGWQCVLVSLKTNSI